MADYPGTSSDDTYAGTNQADTISGGEGNDTLSGAQGDDTISGDAGNDILNGGQGADFLNGGTGNDILNGDEGSDVLNGGTGNDTLNGGVSDDTLTGGLGDDQLTGGKGDDTFVFNFTVNTSGSWVTQTAEFRDGNTPSAYADAVAWNNYLKQLEAWRLEMNTLTGQGDENTDLDGTAYLTTSTKKGGTLLLDTQTYDNDYQYQEWVGSSTATIEGDGYDQILDWTSGANKLVLNGLSADSGAGNYWDTFLNSAQSGGNTVITFDGGSITLVGVLTSIEALVSGGLVDFG
ncbi:MAG: calcium-binding protein [Rhodoferax sp.]|uniref:calcium-binding protein n=1 Tax=Rhodoferax sp. TaxID=50421 RepID=UPI002731D634|nr:calcium-binding protein [Rhodoferax sp.]MDP1529605.1 calcium-binding protein [Rhodoferax sp.]MDP1944948.1 calcium-binding protein [Rhodoferax sp.]